MRKRREGLTKEGLTGLGLTKDGTYFKDGIEMVPAKGMLPERPRYLQLSGGQVLDRANQLKPNKHIPAMIACNRVKGFKMSKQERLGRLLMSLDKDITGLDNKRLNLLTTVRWGISGKTLKEIRDLL